MRGAENCRSGNAAATLIYAVLDSDASLVSGPDDPDFLGHDADSSFRSSVGNRNVLAGFVGWYMRTHDM